jgi:tRNA U34 5-methylaminomethyl-2-thiouridine-forming methyltransferase MnmC
MDQFIYKECQTDDGSTTLFSERFQEHCHSLSGALSETIIRYIRGTQIIPLLALKHQLRVLEVGFGQGYLALALIEFLYKRFDPQCKAPKVHLDSMEIDPGLITIVKSKTSTWLQGVTEEQIQFLSNIEQIEENRWVQSKDPLLSFNLYIGDAKSTVQSLAGNYDIIIHDPFSPPKNPSLWSQSFLKQLYRLSSPTGVLATYSADSRARKTLSQCGWKIHKGRAFGKKKSATLAYKMGVHHPLLASNFDRQNIAIYQDDKPCHESKNH